MRVLIELLVCFLLVGCTSFHCVETKNFCQHKEEHHGVAWIGKSFLPTITNSYEDVTCDSSLNNYNVTLCSKWEETK